MRTRLGPLALMVALIASILSVGASGASENSGDEVLFFAEQAQTFVGPDGSVASYEAGLLPVEIDPVTGLPLEEIGKNFDVIRTSFTQGGAATFMTPVQQADGSWGTLVGNELGRVLAFNTPHLGNIPGVTLGDFPGRHDDDFNNRQTRYVGIDTCANGNYWRAVNNHGISPESEMRGMAGSVERPTIQDFPKIGADSGDPGFAGRDYFSFERDAQGNLVIDPILNSPKPLSLNAPISGVQINQDCTGHVFPAGGDGGIFAFGTEFFGSGGDVGIEGVFASTPSLMGQVLVTPEGTALRYGNIPDRGDRGGQPLNKPIIATCANEDGHMQIAADGGVFAYGVEFLGSFANVPRGDSLFVDAVCSDEVSGPFSGVMLLDDQGNVWRLGSFVGAPVPGEVSFEADPGATGFYYYQWGNDCREAINLCSPSVMAFNGLNPADGIAICPQLGRYQGGPTGDARCDDILGFTGEHREVVTQEDILERQRRQEGL